MAAHVDVHLSAALALVSTQRVPVDPSADPQDPGVLVQNEAECGRCQELKVCVVQVFIAVSVRQVGLRLDVPDKAAHFRLFHYGEAHHSWICRVLTSDQSDAQTQVQHLGDQALPVEDLYSGWSHFESG